jgi:hypothetical protein
MKGHVVALLVAMALAACSGQKTASVEGTWKVSDAKPAPWLEAGQSVDPSIAATYLGKTVTFKPEAIEGPSLLACTNPRYAYVEVPAEGLFQGGLGDNGKAEEKARALGFASFPVHTVMTGCEHDIAYHFEGQDRLAFALDNIIFRMQRTR